MQQAAPAPEALYLGMCIERKQGDREAERSYVIAAQATAIRIRRKPRPIASGACE